MVVRPTTRYLPPARKKSKKKRLLLIIPAVLAVGLIGVGVWKFFDGRNVEEKEPVLVNDACVTAARVLPPRWLFGEGTYVLSGAAEDRDDAPTGAVKPAMVGSATTLDFVSSDSETAAADDASADAAGTAPETVLTAGKKGPRLESLQSADNNTQRFTAHYDETRNAYYLINSATLEVLTDAGESVSLKTFTGDDTQYWTVTDKHDGKVTFASVSSGKYLAAGEDAPVLTETPNSFWYFQKTDPLMAGVYRVFSKQATKLCWDVSSNSTNAYESIILWSSNTAEGQEFRFLPVGNGAYVLTSVRSGYAVSVKNGSGTDLNELELAQMPLFAPGDPGDKLGSRMYWYPDITPDGVVFRSSSSAAGDNPVLDLVKAGADETGNTTPEKGEGLALRPASGRASQVFLPQLVSSNLGTPELATVAARVSVKSGDGDVETWTNVYPVTMKRELYVVLPSPTDLSKVPVVFATTSGALTANVGGSRDTLTLMHSGETLDLAGGGFEQDENGAYHVFMQAVDQDGRTGGTEEYLFIASANTMTVYLWSSEPVDHGRTYIESSPDHSLSATGNALVLDETGKTVYAGGLTQIKGRGNSTWEVPAKKPYQIKLAQKADLLGEGKDQAAKTWVLLAEAGDISDLRNYMMLNLGQEIGLEETPSCKFADLYYDGAYRGLYLLCEKVEIAEGRVEITNLEGENKTLNPDLDSLRTAQGVNKYGEPFKYTVDMVNPENVTGGYLMEFDTYFRDELSWTGTGIRPLVVKSPERASYEEMSYISELMYEAMHEAMKQDGDMGAYFDVTSVSRTWLIYAFARVPDYWVTSSTYFYKDKDDALIHGGPLWDFDASCGNDPPENRLGFAGATRTFFYGNEQFRTETQRVYMEELRPYLVQLIYGRDAEGAAGAAEGIVFDELTETYSRASEIDILLWGTAQFRYTRSSLEQEYGVLKYWLEKQFEYMDSVMTEGTW